MSHLALGMPVPSKYEWYDREEVSARRAALQLYDQVWRRGRLRRAWLALTHHSSRLCELPMSKVIHNGHYIGIQTVEVDQVRGSLGRSNDFDNAFYPRKNHVKERWLQVASAHHLNIGLPPVKLYQIGDIYFVEDGHHRISVARALGQREIEAEVTVWD